MDRRFRVAPKSWSAAPRLLGHRVLVGFAVLGAGLVGAVGAGADEQTPDDSPPPRVKSIKLKKIGRGYVEVIARVRDPDATVTEINVYWGDRYGEFAGNFCNPSIVGDSPTGKTQRFSGIRHRYRRPGRYVLRFSAQSENCPLQTESQIGPVVTRAVQLRPADFKRHPRPHEPRFTG